MNRLRRTYWKPLYVYVQKQGVGEHDAQDVVQKFFAKLLVKEWLADVQRDQGKFRSFLLARLNSFMTDEWRSQHAQKRGGESVHTSLEDQGPELSGPAQNDDPVSFYDLQWAIETKDQALARLRAEYERSGKVRQYELLKPFMAEEVSAADCSELARQLGSSEGAVRVSASRLRTRLGELFREVVADTVAKPADIEDEVRYLCEILVHWT